MERKIKDFVNNYEKISFSENNRKIREITDKLKEDLALDENHYLIKGSVGKGQKSAVPWICIFDREITNTAQKGIYVVLLFSSDMKTLYLSLNQGFMYYLKEFKTKKAKEKIAIVTKEIRKNIEEKSMFSEKIIDLKADKKNKLAPGYELGNIISQEYYIDTLDYTDLLTKIRKLIKIYKTLKKKIGIDIEKFNKKIIVKDSINILESKDSKLDKIFEEVLYDFEGDFYIKRGSEDDLKELNDCERKFDGRKINFEEINKNKSKIGFIGEIIAINHITTTLKRLGKSELVDKIEHTSLLVGDGTGYDIKYTNEKNETIYVEVKTTTLSNPLSTVVITGNELEFSDIKSEYYEMFLIYKLNIEKRECELLIKRGSIKENFDLKSNTYSLKAIKNKNE